MDQQTTILKEKLLQDLTPSERWFFLKTAREYLMKGYPPTENLFYYCYFLTLERRLKELSLLGGNGLMRYLMAHTGAGLMDSLKRYKKLIEEEKQEKVKKQWYPPSEWPPAIT